MKFRKPSFFWAFWIDVFYIKGIFSTSYNQKKILRGLDYTSNNIIRSEVAASNMTDPPQEFDASGVPSLRPYLNYLLKNGAAEQAKVKWGKSERDVIMIDGEKYPI